MGYNILNCDIIVTGSTQFSAWVQRIFSDPDDCWRLRKDSNGLNLDSRYGASLPILQTALIPEEVEERMEQGDTCCYIIVDNKVFEPCVFYFEGDEKIDF